MGTDFFRSHFLTFGGSMMSETVKQKKTEKEHLNMKRVILHNVSVTLLIMGISTVMAQAFFHFSRNSTSVAIIYVLAVMLVARYTTGYRHHCLTVWCVFCKLRIYLSIYDF